jgi:nucleotidyltransferase/DNA polymerase involved in DNA repair
MLAMWVPELPFQLACQRDGALRERPLAFLSPHGGRVRVLWLLNAAARAEGLRSGDAMDLALRRVPGLRLLDPQPQTWWEAQSAFGDFLQHWSPQGQLGRMGEALLELRGTQRLLGPAPDAAQRIRRELARDFGWDSRGGLSLSATAATFASRAARELDLVPEGGEGVFLAPQPLHRLPELHPKLLLRFRRLGLRQLGDVQPIPLPTLAQLLPPDEAPKLLERVRGEDRPRSVHRLRLEPPRLPEEVPMARWILERLWSDARSPRSLRLAWWDVDGQPHRWTASEMELLEPPIALAPLAERAFRALATRRLLVHRLELRVAWGLGQAAGLFQSDHSQKLGRLERTLAHLRKRWPDQPVLPGAIAAEAIEAYSHPAAGT